MQLVTMAPTAAVPRRGLSSIAMQGFMMKRKTGKNASTSRALLRRSIGLKWVTRYFVLHTDGRLLYYRRHPSRKLGQPEGVICHNIADCQIDRGSDNAAVAASRASFIANSFCISVPSLSPQGRVNANTLLVANGPQDHVKWILAFRKTKASIGDSLRDLSPVPESVGDGHATVTTSVKEEQLAIIQEQQHQRLTVNKEAVPNDEKEEHNVDQGFNEDDDNEQVTSIIWESRIDSEETTDESVTHSSSDLPSAEDEMREIVSDVEVQMEPQSQAGEVSNVDQGLTQVNCEIRDGDDKELQFSEETKKMSAVDTSKIVDEDNSPSTEAKVGNSLHDLSPVPDSVGGCGHAAVTTVVKEEQLAIKEEQQQLEDMLAEQQRTAVNENAVPNDEKEEQNADQGFNASIVWESIIVSMETSNESVTPSSGDLPSAEDKPREIVSDVEVQMEPQSQAGEVSNVDQGLTQVNYDISDGDDKELKFSEEAKNISAAATSKIVDEDNSPFTERQTKKVSASVPVLKEAATTVLTGNAKDKSEMKGGGDSLLRKISKDDNGGLPLLSPSIANNSQELVQRCDTEVTAGATKAVKTNCSSDGTHLNLTVPEEEMQDSTIFAFGDSLPELTKALDGQNTLFGILATSQHEIMTNQTIATIPRVQRPDNNLVAFVFQYKGNDDTHANEKYWKELETVCKKHSFFDKLNPINAENVEHQILQHFGVPVNKARVSAPTTTSKKERRGTHIFGSEHTPQDMSIYSSATAATAFKHTLEVLGSDAVSSGEEVLRIVRKPLGYPYNWVLFEPSETQLRVKDAGSGGVVELATVLREYNDCVLFGLLRLSFLPKQGSRRHVWCGLEWKGENCHSVEMMRQLRNCSEPMMKKIGDRSCDISSAGEMTPEMVVEKVKRSIDSEFNVTVGAMKNAHEEEQKEIKSYWDNKEEGRKKLEYKQQQEKEQEHTAKTFRESRRARWAEISVTKLLQELGMDGMPGWVLLEKKNTEAK